MTIKSVIHVKQHLRQKALLEQVGSYTQPTFDRDVLETLAEAVRTGAAVLPELQILANRIIVKALESNALPSRPKHRPKGALTDDTRKLGAVRRYRLERANGANGEDASEIAAERFHTTSRTIKRWDKEVRRESQPSTEFSPDAVAAEMGLNLSAFRPVDDNYMLIVKEHKPGVGS